jgi:hypothetical protein
MGGINCRLGTEKENLVSLNTLLQNLFKMKEFFFLEICVGFFCKKTRRVTCQIPITSAVIPFYEFTLKLVKLTELYRIIHFQGTHVSDYILNTK